MSPEPPSLAIPLLIRARRWWLLLLAAWATLVGLALYLNAREIREQAHSIAVEGARQMFQMVVLTRSWNASHAGVYVPVTPRTQPNPYLEHPQRDVTTTDGLALTMINPAYMTRLIAEIAANRTGSRFRLTSLNPVQPANQADPWEAEALAAFEIGVRESTAVTGPEEARELRYMAPLKVEEPCLKCHAQQGYQIGDIRGGISISIPYGPIAAAQAAGLRQALLAHLAVFGVGAALGWWLLEMLRRRWFDLATSQHQLLQSEKLASVGQLAAGVAHEINNPIGFVSSNLNSLRSYSQTLVQLLEDCRAGKAGPEDFAQADFDYLKTDLEELLQESAQGLERVKKIVTDLKDFSRVDQSPWQEADLNACCDSTLNVLGHELRRVEVRRQYGELPLVPCRPSQINQVILNLLRNAAQASPDGALITLSTGQADGMAWIEVTDQGCGMDATAQARLFEPFYTTKPVGQGTGLGLALSYDICRKHGGSIRVKSAPGQGSSFRLSLPLQHDQEPPP